MILAFLLLITGLVISAVAIYYSVVGLTAIFAAAAIPIIVMGGALEIAKLVCATWLKANWERVPALMKVYMSTAVIVLMIITSMGIFGFLSKAHLDQNIVSGDVTSKIAILDEKIKTEKENIDAARKALKQMDEAVDQLMARSDSERGAERSVQIRRQQQAERARLQKDITTAQSNIGRLNEERAPIAAEVRKVEAEVGPIKYIAKLIYGDNPDSNILEKAVTWVIIMIVVVFDPLAVIMLLAAQMTFGWARQHEEEYPTIADLDRDVGEPPTSEEKQEIEKDQPNDNFQHQWPFMSPLWPFPTYKETTQTHTEEVPATEPVTDQGGEQTAQEEQQQEAELQMPIEQWNKMIEEAEKEVEKEKSAKAKWKAENPNDTIKHQERLRDSGIIDKLPWEEITQEEKESIASTYLIFPELHTTKMSTPEPDYPRNRPDLTEVIEPNDQKKK